MTQTARVYGGSLYDLAAEEMLTDTILEQLCVIRNLFRENPDYLALLCEPSLSKEERTGLIETAFGNQAERYLVSFMKLLCERGILREFSGCCEAYIRRYNADHNIAEAVVTSAVALSETQTAALKEKLEKRSGKQIMLVQKIDPSVVGGLCVELEGKQLDGTVQNRISDISRKLKEVVM
ncbi:MAG: ATP synthase F1 subunit delta [Lachnospiraceae bacterium]|nr:ATP synthase F1 subunit delta [Lachnospiraceae bacterium]